MQAREIAAQVARSARPRASPPSRSRACRGLRRGRRDRCGAKSKVARRAPAPHFHVVRFGRLAHRRARVREIGQLEQEIAQLASARDSSSPSSRLTSSPRPATSARIGAASSPFDFATPICFDSALRRDCSSCVRIWMSLRARFERLEARGVERDAALGESRRRRRRGRCRRRLMSSIVQWYRVTPAFADAQESPLSARRARIAIAIAQLRQSFANALPRGRARSARRSDVRRHVVGKVALAGGVRVRLVVRVAIALAVAELLHELGRRVAQAHAAPGASHPPR